MPKISEVSHSFGSDNLDAPLQGGVDLSRSAKEHCDNTEIWPIDHFHDLDFTGMEATEILSMIAERTR